MNEKIARFLADNKLPTPCLVFDLDVVEDNYRRMTTNLPDTKVFYAVKANPAPEVLRRLAALGSCFDTASPTEIDMALAAGASPDRISYGNTIKKKADIAYAHDRGIDLFAFDCEAELDKIADAAPGARVFCRLLTSGAGADWPLSRKFGCDAESAFELMLMARDRGVAPYGLSFHVGSQQKDPEQWDEALRITGDLFRALEARGVLLQMVNLGGGFPAIYRDEMPGTEAYGEAIRSALVQHFGNHLPETLIEPGRGMVGNAGVIRSEVVLVARRRAEDDRPWVYLDIGKFGGLAETIDEAIQYPITAVERCGMPEPVILAGPSCDSVDVLYEHADYRLPNDLEAGDHVDIHATGAYTTTYASVGFNGFPPLTEFYI